jgi:hypothetical protein
LAKKSKKENKFYNIDKQKPSDLSNLTLTIPEEIVERSLERELHIPSWIENLAEEIGVTDIEEFRNAVYKYLPITDVRPYIIISFLV